MLLSTQGPSGSAAIIESGDFSCGSCWTTFRWPMVSSEGFLRDLLFYLWGLWPTLGSLAFLVALRGFCYCCIP